MNLNSDILHFCQIGNLAAVEKCLEEGIDVDFQNSEGETPLQISAANGFSEIVCLLLSEGASIDLPNNYGWTPLMHASRHGHSSTVVLLLEMKAKVNICNKLGLSPIVAAVWGGDLPTLKLLKEAGAIMDHLPLNQSNECELSSLMAAAIQGHENIFGFLLEEGVIIDQVSPVTGLSSLMLAACGGHKKIVQIIVEHDGDTNKIDICGRSALDLAIACCKEDVKVYLESMTITKFENEQTDSVDILQAVRSGDILKVKSALKQNPELLNTFDPDDGITPLMIASMLGHSNIINLLISGGANLDLQDVDSGWTALMYAVFHRRADTVNLLLEKGASVDICAANGYTALDLAQHTDNSDSTITENLMSKMIVDLSPRTPFANSTSSTLERQKLSGSERFFPRRSQTQAGLKSWIGGVAQNLQNKMFTHLSPRRSERISNSDSQALDETIVNDVFLEPKSSFKEESDEAKLNPSNLLSPDKYLASALKEHKVEAIKPPLPPILYYDFMSSPAGKPPCDKNSKTRRNSLQVPNLLRNYSRKKASVFSNKTRLKRDVILSESSQSLQISSEKVDSTSSSSKPLEFDNKVDKSHEMESHNGNLTALLEEKSLQKYVANFREQEIDIKSLKDLSRDDLKEIGVESCGSQEKILEILSKLQCTE